MKTVAERIEQLQQLEKQQLQQGGAKAVDKQHQGGKLTARERLEVLFDPGTFVETDMFVRHRCTSFGMDKTEIAGDGVVCGHGLVGGRTVFAYSQDFTSRAGTMGEMQSKKICRVMDLAIKTGKSTLEVAIERFIVKHSHRPAGVAAKR